MVRRGFRDRNRDSKRCGVREDQSGERAPIINARRTSSGCDALPGSKPIVWESSDVTNPRAAGRVDM